MNFPAREIYYPLKPGSVYSGQGMDKVITVAGYVSPKLYPDIESATKVDYFSPTPSRLLKIFTPLTKNSDTPGLS